MLANMLSVEWWLNNNVDSSPLSWCVPELAITGLENGWSPIRRQAIIGTNYDFSLITRPVRHRGTNLSEILIKWHCHWQQFRFNTLGPRQNDRHLVDDLFKCIFLNENVWIRIKISLKFIPKVTINNIPASVKIMAWFHGCITDAYMRHSVWMS